MYTNRSDFIKVLVYTTFFSALFFAYNTASSPYFETTFDSASIDNKEISVISDEGSKKDISVEEVIPEEKPEPKKNRIKKERIIPFTIDFNPENIRLDSWVVDQLKILIDAPSLKDKITPLHVLIDAERQEPRGQVVGNKLILSSSISSDSERLKVFVHELGHIIDIFYLKKGIFSDPSDTFYAISWESFQTKKKDQKIHNFVSGYALSNKYEDFAESFAFYIFHNDDFLARANSDPVLRAKYDFFRTQIFSNDEFVGTSFQTAAFSDYFWDTTKIQIDTKKYLYYMR